METPSEYTVSETNVEGHAQEALPHTENKPVEAPDAPTEPAGFELKVVENDEEPMSQEEVDAIQREVSEALKAYQPPEFTREDLKNHMKKHLKNQTFNFFMNVLQATIRGGAIQELGSDGAIRAAEQVVEECVARRLVGPLDLIVDMSNADKIVTDEYIAEAIASGADWAQGVK